MKELVNITTGKFFDDACKLYEDRIAINYCGKKYSYKDFRLSVDNFARRLLTLGVKRGDHVGIWCETEPNAIFALFALSKIGAVACMLGTSLQKEGLIDLVVRSDVNLLLIGSGYKDVKFPQVAKEIKDDVPLLRDIIFIGEESRDWGFKRLDSIKEASEEELNKAEAQAKPEDTSLILYTSGTTSAPKCVMTSHYNRVNSGIQQAEQIRATKEDIFLVAMPIFHCFCLSVNIFASIAVGACLYIPSSRRTVDILSAISMGKCTVFSCVPTLFHALITRPDFKDWDISSLRVGYIGGSACPKPMFYQIEEKLEMTLISSLGQTEATAGLTSTKPEDPIELRVDCVGPFFEYVQGKIVDIQTKKELALGMTGEIAIKGYNVMQGYYKNDEETKKTLVDGWLYTGDTGFLDGDGNLHLTGRVKELIIRGGENISPAEIENIALREKGVDSCKAIGVPSEHYGEEVCLCIVSKSKPKDLEENLMKKFKELLPYYKVPKYTVFVDEFPLTATGKVQLGELKKCIAEKLGLN